MALPDAVAACAGTAVSKLCFYPLDKVKVALQSSEKGESSHQVISGLCANPGKLYHGVGAKLVKSCTQKFIYVSLYAVRVIVAVMTQHHRAVLRLLGIVECCNQGCEWWVTRRCHAISHRIPRRSVGVTYCHAVRVSGNPRASIRK